MDEVARLRDSARAAPLARSARQSVATCHQAAVLRRERRAAGLRACDRGAQFVYQIFCLFIHSLTDTARDGHNGGNLGGCDTCPAAWHVECLPGERRTAAQLPSNWSCPACATAAATLAA